MAQTDYRTHLTRIVDAAEVKVYQIVEKNGMVIIQVDGGIMLRHIMNLERYGYRIVQINPGIDEGRIELGLVYKGV
jgi:hypothetical protein